MPAVVPDVAIVTHDTDHFLLNLLRSLAPLQAAHAIGTVHVWDNASSDLTAPVLDRFASGHSDVRAYRSRVNVHHGPALDALLREACRAEWVLLLDSDTEVRPSLARALAALAPAGAAFAGQIHPELPQLYAYLAHLLVHRPTYLDLPPFRHHGAPGIEYFRAIELERRPYLRVRWSDHVTHFGQGTLRRLVERGDRGNEFFAFAHAHETRQPRSEARLRRERALQVEVRAFVADAPAPPADASRAVTSIDATTTAPKPARSTRRARTLRWVTAPRLAGWLRDARRLGLGQIDEEALHLARLLRVRRPHRVLEIGSAHGGSLLLWSRAAAEDATVVSVDWPPWELDDPAEPRKREALAAVGSARQRVLAIRGDSHDRATRDQVRQCFDGQPIDFLFIDGDRSAAGVAADFADYAPLVRAGGVVALADIHPHSRGWGGGAPAFWQSVRARHRHTEIVADPAQDGHGIGIVWV
jgi:predicted O-methyltransferase YrrM